MTQTLSSAVCGIFRAAALVSMMLLFSGVGLAQKVVTARAAIPFKFWAEGYEFQAGDYVFDNQVPGQPRSIVKERTQLPGSQSFSTAFRQKRKNPKRYSCFETESTFYLNSGVFRLATWLRPSSSTAARRASNSANCR
jgi:hypothetical protein